MRLSDLYQKLDAEERRALATKAGVSDGYLWQLATRWQGRRASLGMLQKLSDADKRLTISDMAAEFAEAAKAAA